MKATLEYNLPADEEAFNAALHGLDCRLTLTQLILELTNMAYPNDKPVNQGLATLLSRLQQQMEELGLNQILTFSEGDDLKK